MILDPWHPDWDGPHDLLPLLARGRLDQICMNCGMTDPAGGPCSRCGSIVHWSYWHPIHRSRAQRRMDAAGGNLPKQNRTQADSGS